MRSGSVVIREGAALPHGMERSQEQLVPGWSLIKDADVVETEKALAEANWHLFYAEPEIDGDAYSRDLKRAIKKAVQRLTRKVEAQGLNAVEITFLLVTKVVGFYYVSVTGHASQIQQSPLSPDPHLRQRTFLDRTKGDDFSAA